MAGRADVRCDRRRAGLALGGPVAQLFTFGGHNRLPAAAIDELLAGIGAAVDAAGGGFTMAYQTVVVTASR
jgi:hypothetical protein